jgi:hypothetical protein
MTLQLAETPERVYRLGRRPHPWVWPDWSHAGVDGTFGNRFDDPDSEYRVLYASTQREATFRECLARFRPDPAVLAAVIFDNDDDPLSPTTVASTATSVTPTRSRTCATRSRRGSCTTGLMTWTPAIFVAARRARSRRSSAATSTRRAAPGVPPSPASATPPATATSSPTGRSSSPMNRSIVTPRT